MSECEGRKAFDEKRRRHLPLLLSILPLHSQAASAAYAARTTFHRQRLKEINDDESRRVWGEERISEVTCIMRGRGERKRKEAKEEEAVEANVRRRQRVCFAFLSLISSLFTILSPAFPS